MEILRREGKPLFGSAFRASLDWLPSAWFHESCFRALRMIEDGLGFQLVPWPFLDQRIGEHIAGVVRDSGTVDWSFGRKRGLGL